MTLVNRVSTFFLVALAVCLIGFSLTMTVFIRHHMLAEFDAHLRSSLNILSAGLEAESDSIKWQPNEHTIELGDEHAQNEIRWILVDEQHQLIDRSDNLTPTDETDATLLQLATKPHASSYDISQQGRWRYLQKLLVASDPAPSESLEFDEFERILVTVARPADQLSADLYRLAILAVALPLVFWSVAALLGRAFCRRALLPVVTMAQQARSTKFNDFSSRLPVSSQRDELADMAEAFNGLLDRLELSFRRQAAFAGDAAHQLKTPLTVLRGQIDVAMLRPRSPAEYQSILQTLSDQTYQLQRIIDSLLMLARDDNERPGDWQTVQFDQWLNEYAQQWSEHQRGSDITWSASPNASLETSPSMLRVVLDNFIDNAAKFSPPGTPIEVCCQPHGKLIEVSVSNQGSTISADDQAKIFEPFFRSQEARRQGISGTGLGLAMVARVAERLGGSVRCDSSTANVTRFVLALPNSTKSMDKVICHATEHNLA
ncbi:HAMP domain-containing protein [Bremerella cremea]|uniref:histidine kinase n=1 Tax=Bremerella cremea TaxID=1031537 RepID=A0A368KPA6_9BACT|nr:ATP-binding protein [Bremerella cremea]RCS46383.1 HAMP domain-containing protein [Bremerella cremea]